MLLVNFQKLIEDGINIPESFQNIRDRCSKILEYSKKLEYDTILLVTHGIICNELIKSIIPEYKYNNTITGHGLITSSGMTSDHDPSFRIFVYNDNWTFLDYHQYSCSLTNIIKTNKFSCQNTYNFTTEYNLPDVSLDSFLKLFSYMKNSTEIINKYHRHYSPGINTGSCDKQCQNNYLSEILVS